MLRPVRLAAPFWAGESLVVELLLTTTEMQKPCLHPGKVRLARRFQVPQGFLSRRGGLVVLSQELLKLGFYFVFFLIMNQ